MRLLFMLLLTWPLLNSWAQTPAVGQSKPVLILNATAHIGDGTVIDNAAIAFADGKITMVADARLIRIDTTGYRVIMASGKHIYPGFIALNTQLGLTEVDAVRATRDFAEVGEFTPHVRALVAYNTDSRILPTIRSNGVLLAQIVPRGGGIAGTSSAIQLDAWNWEDAAVAADNGVHLYWDALYRRRGWWSAQSGVSKNKAWEKTIQELQQFLDEAKAYHERPSTSVVHQPFAAMEGLFTGEKRLFIHVNGVQDIRQAMVLAAGYDLSAILVGARDAWMIADEIAAQNIPVVLHSPHSLPGYPDAAIDQAYKSAYWLAAAGVDYCLSIDGSWQVRNLPFVAGTTVQYNVDYEAALTSITAAPARILGIDDLYGTLEEGKSATLLLAGGDVLDMRSHAIEAAFIDGRAIDLNNHQQQLYEQYKAKYGLE